MLRCASQQPLTSNVANQVVSMLESLGWMISFEKSHLSPSTLLTLLGFIIDTIRMAHTVPAKRLAKMITAVNAVFDQLPPCSARAVQGVAGLIHSMTLAPGFVCRLRSRYVLAHCREASISGRWDDVSVVSDKAFEELLWWRSNRSSVKPRPIKSYLRKPDYTLSADAVDLAQDAGLEDATSLL